MALDSAAVDEFRKGVRGPVLMPGDPTYDEVRQVWNGMIDRKPPLIVRCNGNADVIAAVNFAREQGLPASIRGGGHNGAGLGGCDGGLVLDLSLMNGVRVDPDARTIRAEGALAGRLTARRRSSASLPPAASSRPPASAA
jgi:FAD/FMN-containing dehydrogenase